jgi:hypothetical protein
MNTNYCHTLCWNFTTEVEKATKLLYDLNSKIYFKHIIVDLGFPLIEDKIPDDIEAAKKENTRRLKDICKKYGSLYLKLPNVGVSQNWTAVFKACNMDESDILIGADPDEHPIHPNWIRAMDKVLHSPEDIALASLMMTDHLPLIHTVPLKQKIINGELAYWTTAAFNWALIGISGEFLNKIGEIPFPKEAERYGWIESELLTLIIKHNYKWVILPGYHVKHTDYELGDAGTSKLLRLWKNQIIHKIKEFGQISFEEYLGKLKKGEIKVEL